MASNSDKSLTNGNSSSDNLVSRVCFTNAQDERESPCDSEPQNNNCLDDIAGFDLYPENKHFVCLKRGPSLRTTVPVPAPKHTFDDDDSLSSDDSVSDDVSVYKYITEEKKESVHENIGTIKPKPNEEKAPSPTQSRFTSLHHKRIVQMLVLVSICVMYGVHGGTIEAPTSLQEQIMSELDVDAFTYNLLYSLYSFPNVVLVFVGGILVDSILGLRMAGIVYTGLLLLGMVIMAVGAFAKIFPLMVVGRFIYGIGGESFQIVTQKYIVRWFHGKMLNIAFGIAFSFYRVCGFLQLNLNQAIYRSLRYKFGFSGPHSIGLAFLIGAAGIFLGLLFSLVLYFFDRKFQPSEPVSEAGKFKQLLDSMKQITKFGPNFYLLCVCLVFFTISFYPFNQLAQGFFISKYLFPSDQAVFVLSLSNIVATIASPIFGVLISYVGYDLYVQHFIYILELLVHSGYAFTFISPIILIVFNGLASSIFICVFWPLPGRIIKEEQLGIAYGVMLSLQNLGLAIAPLVTGTIVDVAGYLFFEFHILFLGSVAAIFASILLYTNLILSNGILNESAQAREKAPK